MANHSSFSRRVLAWFFTEPGLELLTCGICLLSPLIFFGRPLLAGRVLLTSDILDFFWPYHQLWATYVQDGIAPLWNPYLFSGMPFLADPQSVTLYPLNALFLIFPSLTAIQIYALLGYALLTVFTYYFMRTLKQSRLAGLCAALSLSYGLYMVIHWPHLTILHVVLWLPLQLGLTEQLAATRRVRYAVLLAVALAMQVFGGNPQFLLYSVIVLVGYQLAHLAFAREHRGRLITCFGMAFLLGLMLSAAQLLPSVELALLSSRQALSYEQFSAYSMRPVMLIQLVAPFLFGAPSDFLYSVRPFVPGWHWEVVFYAGAVPLLCLLSLPVVRKWSSWREMFWWTVFFVGLVLAFGNNTPIYPMLFRFPVFNWFRSAGRHLFLVSLALAIIAGFRIERLLHAGRMVIARTFGIFLIVTSSLVALCILSEADALKAHYASSLVRPELLLPLVTFTLMFLVLWPFGDRSNRWRRPTRMLLIGLIAGDLLLTSGTTVPSISRSAAMSRLAEFQDLTHVLPRDGKRFWYLRPQNSGNTHLFAQLPFATAYNPLIILRYAQLARFSGPNPTSSVYDMPATTREALWNLLDVGYLLVPKALLGKSLLDADCGQRIGGYCFTGSDTRLELSPGRQLEFALPAGEALTGIGFVSALASSVDVPDQTPVARLLFQGSNNDVLGAVTLLAGIHTAEWAADCLQPGQETHHQQPLIARSWDASRASGSACLAHTYFSAVDIHTDLSPSRLVVQNVSAGSVLWLDGLSVRTEGGKTVGYVLERGVYDAIVSLQNPDFITDRFAVFRRRPAWGHAWPVERVQAMNSTAFLQALDSPGPGLDLAHVAYVDKDDLPALLRAWPGLLSTKFDPNATVHMTNLNPNSLTLEVTSSAPAFIILSEVHYPGWVALIDHEESDMLRVNHALRGIVVPGGMHVIHIVYQPNLLNWGVALGVLGLGLVVALLWVSARSGRRMVYR